MKKPKSGQIEKCTHRVPRNQFGILAFHSLQNRGMAQQDLKKIIEGPIASIHKDIDRELAKPADERKMPEDF